LSRASPRHPAGRPASLFVTLRHGTRYAAMSYVGPPRLRMVRLRGRRPSVTRHGAADAHSADAPEPPPRSWSQRVVEARCQDARVPAVISSPDLGVIAVAAAGVLCAFSCVVDALPEQCLRRRPGAIPLVVAIFRTKRLLREYCSATCQRRRRPGQVRHRQGRLQITAVLVDLRLCSDQDGHRSGSGRSARLRGVKPGR